MKEIESAATLLSHSEIAMMKPDPYRAVINKIEELIANPNPAYDELLSQFIYEMAGIDYNLSVEKMRGIWYNESRKTYIVERRHNGKSTYIGCSKKFGVAKEMYLSWCKENNTKP